MAYFAQVENGVVLQVIAVSNNDAPDPAPEHSEPLGQAFIASIGLPGTWIQTSYNANFRGHFAGIGFLWDGENFIPPPPEPEPDVV